MTERYGLQSGACACCYVSLFDLYGEESGEAVIKLPPGAGSGSINSELRPGSIYQGFEEI
jgi:hypothetical protein